VILSEAYRRQVNLHKHSTHNEPRELELYWSLTVDALTSLLPSIEHVRLRVPLHVGCSTYFARLTKLKSLDWDGRSLDVRQLRGVQKSINWKLRRFWRERLKRLWRNHWCV